MVARRFRPLLVVLAGLSVLAVAGVFLARPGIEAAVRDRIVREAAARGVQVQVDEVHVGMAPPLTLRGLHVEKPGVWSATSPEARITLLPWARRLRVAMDALALQGPNGLTVDVAPAEWEMPMSAAGRVPVDLRSPGGLSLVWVATPDGGRLDGTASDAPLGQLLTVRRNGLPVVDPGTVTGTVHVVLAGKDVGFDVDVAGRAVRLAALENEDTPDESPAVVFGEPTDVTVRMQGSWRKASGELDLRSWHVTVGGASLSGAVSLRDGRGDPSLDLTLDVERVDFAALFRASGLARVEAVAARDDVLDGGDLGAASLSARFQGRLGDPATFTVEQRLDFTPPPRVPPAIGRLRGDFVHRAPLTGGGETDVPVSPTSPDFIAIGDVPPLVLRTLLLAEDAGFYGHRGIDLREIPGAVLTNWSRGRPARGASTITQQLAKNLFLSRDKRLGRKLQELSIALLLESTLSKHRILEIYLNVIEWGPGIFGLRPAARHYFHKEPAELTAHETAFLVALIPGPIKYQRSFAHGTLSPGFRPLVDGLLAKLRSVDALTEEEYQGAIAEDLVVEPGIISGGR
jgi:hypothetical protein